MSATSPIVRSIGPALREQVRRVTDRVAVVGGLLATVVQFSAITTGKPAAVASAIGTLVIALCGLFGLRTRARWTPYAYVAILWTANGFALVSFGPLLGMGTMYILAIALAFMFMSPLLRWIVVLGMSCTPVIVGALFEYGVIAGSPSFETGDLLAWTRLIPVAVASMIGIGMIVDYSMRHLRIARAELARALHDEREARQSNDSVEREIARAQRSDLIVELAADVGSNIGAALATISSRAELLMSELDDEARACLADVIAASSAARSTMRSLTLFAPEAHVGDARSDAGLAASAIPQMVRHTIPRRIALIMKVEGEAHVPLSASDVTRILTNLVLNARDAINDAGTISVYVRRAGGSVTIEVVDDGSGMDVETHARLFQPFFTTKPIGRGTGLGLATAKILVERAGGEISCSSSLGTGTRFTIRLPAVDVKNGGSRPELADSGAGAANAVAARSLIACAAHSSSSALLPAAPGSRPRRPSSTPLPRSLP